MGGTIRFAAIATVIFILTVALLAVAFVRSLRPRDDLEAPAAANVALGLSIHEPSAYAGYTLLAPMKSTRTYLLDMRGQVVRTWRSDCTPGLRAELLDNGHLLRAGWLRAAPLAGGGAGGRMQEFSWDGKLLWDLQYANDHQLPHHDFARLPNGNVLLIVWEKRTRPEAVAAGRRPDFAAPFFLTDGLIEVKPTGPTTGEVVWEWHLWDHIVQDHDRSKPNYGQVAGHPELVDLNYWRDFFGTITRPQGGTDKLRSIGYLGASSPGRPSDNFLVWSHLNGVAYHPDFDQIMVTSLEFGEFWILDHSTTAAEAATHRGGKSGKGGDLLYRWGNPGAYAEGDEKPHLFAPHHAHWIPRGRPGAGRVLVFNNGPTRPDGNYSSVEEVALPVDSLGRYTPAAAAEQPVWSYRAPDPADFYSALLSGAQRLPNGHTLITSGINGTLLEVTADKQVVWKYINPIRAGTGNSSDTRGTGSARRNAVFSGPSGGGSVFRVQRYGSDFPGLAGKDLRPGRTLEEIAAAEAEATATR